MSRPEILEPKQFRDISNGRRLASINETASYCGVHPRTIRRAIADGRLTGYRFGGKLVRVDLNEVDERLLQQIPTAG